MKKVIVLLMIWISLSFIGYLVARKIFDTTELNRLIDFGKPVYGQVASKDAGNHATLAYSYVVEGAQYEGTGSAGHGNPRFEEIAVGQDLIVVYDTSNPSRSIPGYPQNYLLAQNSGMAYFTFALSITWLVIITTLYFVSRVRKRESSDDLALP
jgi:hypothetical protein